MITSAMRGTKSTNGRTGTAARGGASLAGILVLGVAAVTAQGCSSKDASNNGATGPSGPPSVTEYATTLAASACTALKECCGKAKHGYDPAACSAWMTLKFQREIDSVKRGRVTYDASAAEVCAKAISTRMALCTGGDAGMVTSDAGLVDPVAVACEPVMKGTVAPGGACDVNAECKKPDGDFAVSCANDTTPRDGGSGLPGPSPTRGKVCYELKLRAAPGEDCSLYPGSSTDFRAAMCDPAKGSCEPKNVGSQLGTCKAFAKDGEDCISNSGSFRTQCEPGTYCDTQDTRTCKRLANEGEVCGGFGGSGASGCADGLFCDTSGSEATCARRRAEGESCTSSDDCLSESCDRSQPNPDGGIPVGVCVGQSVEPPAINQWTVSPRACGFGPLSPGQEDAGIVVAPSADGGSPFQSSSPSFSSEARWYERLVAE